MHDRGAAGPRPQRSRALRRTEWPGQGPPARRSPARHACCSAAEDSHRSPVGLLPSPPPGPGPHLLGTAVKLENTYLAIMSRHVSVSSRWRFFKLSSAWAIEFSSADPKLALVRDVWILLEGGALVRSGTGRGDSSPTGGQSSRHASAGRAAPTNPPPGRTASQVTAWQTVWTHHPRERSGKASQERPKPTCRSRGSGDKVETDVPSPKHKRVRGRLGGRTV